MAKNLEIPFLLDFYGEMLTQKQHDCLVYYYEEDLEERLGLAKRFNEMKKGIDEIVECADNINEYNLNHTLSMEVNDNVARIKTLASFLKEG